MEFDENLNPVNPPVQPNPWEQPPVYPQPLTPPPVVPPVPPTPQPAFVAPTPPPQPPKPTPTPLVLPPLPKPAEPKPATFPMAALVMMFIVTIASLVLVFMGNQFGSSFSQDRNITVSGTGIAYSAPDVAKIDFGVRSTARNLADSQKANADAIAKIKNDLAPYEIKPEDIQTINYNINPDYIYLPSQKPTLSGYSTYHFLRLTMRKLDLVDAILQTLGNSGATDISQINFTIENLADVKNDAREKAIASAKDMATQLANLSGAKLGKVIAIKEVTATADPNSPQSIDGMGGGGGTGGGPGVEQGSLSVTSNVTLTYSLK